MSFLRSLVNLSQQNIKYLSLLSRASSLRGQNPLHSQRCLAMAEMEPHKGLATFGQYEEQHRDREETAGKADETRQGEVLWEIPLALSMTHGLMPCAWPTHRLS